MTPAARKALKFLPPLLGLLVLAGVIAVLHGALARISLGGIVAALAAITPAQIRHALGLLAVSLCIMTIYDIPGILFARRLESLPAIGIARIALVSFCAYALSHVLGAPALSGAAIRLRLYAQWRVSAASIARIIALSGSTFALGAAALASVILLAQPQAIPLFGHDISRLALRAAGIAGLVLMACYVVAAGQANRKLNLFGRPVPLPGSRLAIIQIFLSCTDITIACAILFSLLPATPGLSLAHVLAIYLAAVAGGSLSGVPAGLGVFDTVLLLGLSPYLPAATSISAILLFRVLYALIPASAAGLCFTAHEIFLNLKGHEP